MGKATGFLEYQRMNAKAAEPCRRIVDFHEFHSSLPKEEQQLQGARCMDCGVPFCQAGMMIGQMVSGCPLHNLIPEWNDLVYKGNWYQAYQRLSKTHPLPEFTSRVCPALCEAACTCNLNDDPVAAKANERMIIETAFEKGWVRPQIPTVCTGKKIAVVGSGPAGLAAALMLNRRGHSVSVFERKDRPGGLLQYGIPNMKLEKDVIARRVDLMVQDGVEFITNTDVGKDIRAEQLMQQYDRIILACGASHPRDIKASGRETEGIYFAVDFLSQVTKSLLDSDLQDRSFPNPKNKHVVIIGGGDTGNDCVGTVIRLGAKSVVQLEMMPKSPDSRAADNPWPQWPKVCKTDYGQEEAIAVFGQDPRVYQTTVTEFIANGKGELCQIKTVGLEWQKDLQSGKTNMVTVPDSEKVMAADMVLIAAGFLGTEDYIARAFGVELDERNNVAAAAGTYQTSIKNVFTAGDTHRGQSLVVWAIREGVEAAKEVDKSLMGYTNL